LQSILETFLELEVELEAVGSDNREEVHIVLGQLVGKVVDIEVVVELGLG